MALSMLGIRPRKIMLPPVNTTRRLRATVVATLIAAASAHAQRPAPLVSPELLPDGGVTFRFMAPKAAEVKVAGQFGPTTALTKNPAGAWSVTIPKVPAGVHEYHFTVDGLDVIDPQNSLLKPQRWPGSSILQVPATPPAPWDWQNIPHGVIHEHTYLSKALGKPRRIIVYTPPGAAGFDDYGPANSDALCRELLQDIIPLVESTYPVDAKPAARGFAGLSMGGHHALTIALNHHATFGWIGAFSAAPPPQKTIAAGLDDAAGTNRDLKLLWIACGKSDFLSKRNHEFNALLKEKGIRYEFVETEGDHSWPVWRRYLCDFAPLLFR
jgi:enterochelin esterase family protein